MATAKHNPEEPVFGLQETDRRTKINRILMALMAAGLGVFAWFSAAG